jgi:spore coat polysaccharide biosynthesis protein SpsF (cytidylyltransferase family)
LNCGIERGEGGGATGYGAEIRTVAIIQARMGSTRLPGKVMTDLDGQPLLALVLERTAKTPGLDAVAVAAPDLPRDDVVADYCAANGFECVRGSESDVLDRYHHAAERLEADIVVRITADCPLIDPEVVGRLLSFRAENDFDYAGNATGALPPGRNRFPDGLDCEVFTRAALDLAHREATEPYDREHVTPFLGRDERLKRGVLEAEEDYGDERWTVDYPSDLERVREIVNRCGRRAGYREILGLQPSRT